MSKSYRAGAEWGPRFSKPRHEPTIEEELEEMAIEVFKVINAWKPVDSPYELEEEVSQHRYESNAIITLHDIAEGQGVDLRELADETEFTIEEPNARTEYETWYIITGTLED